MGIVFTLFHYLIYCNIGAKTTIFTEKRYYDYYYEQYLLAPIFLGFCAWNSRAAESLVG